MKKVLFPLIIIILSASCTNMIQRNPEITIGELREHVETLASDEFEGRATGSEGDALAADYIRKELQRSGFKSLTGDKLQEFTVPAEVSAGESNTLESEGNVYEAGTDFSPFAFSGNGSLNGQVVFAGYGFNIDIDSLQWKDYSGVDVAGKWVMILRADPEVDQPTSIFAPYSADRDKALLAKDNGAAGVLLVSGELFDPKDEIEKPGSDVFSVGIPALRITRQLADNLLAGVSSIGQLETQLNENRKPGSFDLPSTVNATSEIIVNSVETRNVAMVFESKDPLLKSEYIVIGAHYDHLGWGGPGSGSRAVDTVAIHYGADDNASGVAMMIELAEKLASNKGAQGRSIVAVAFSGEESGLLGSKYFVNNSPIDLKAVNAMVNLDMVGRMRESSILQIGGVGTATGLRELVMSKADTIIIKLSLSDEGYGPSDHSSFYGKNIPVLFVSTGAHLDYHTPNDKAELINFDGMISISAYLTDLVAEMTTSKERLAYLEAGPKEQPSRGSRRKGVTLGIMPDFAGSGTDGLRADFVTPGKPAAIGGMIKGDLIVAINGKPVSNIQDYMFRLNQLKFGETIHVEIVRDGNKEVLLIQL